MLRLEQSIGKEGQVPKGSRKPAPSRSEITLSQGRQWCQYIYRAVVSAKKLGTHREVVGLSGAQRARRNWEPARRLGVRKTNPQRFSFPVPR
ncbi:MAG: hypothetical protein KJP05_02615, partial [Deltaproteobacteria bacterium]|nr:hypothetical protein [Deltaproteobacteria bacterium]